MSLCEFGHHDRKRPGYFYTLGEAIMHAPVHLSGDLWVAGRAAPLVKRRIRAIRRGKDKWGSIRSPFTEWNNWTPVLQYNGTSPNSEETRVADQKAPNYFNSAMHNERGQCLNAITANLTNLVALQILRPGSVSFQQQRACHAARSSTPIPRQQQPLQAPPPLQTIPHPNDPVQTKYQWKMLYAFQSLGARSD